MLNFFSMANDYESRKVGRWDSEDGNSFVSTAKVVDGSKPFETAFKHPDYNEGKMVIVESYDSREQAIAGHAKWEKAMTEGPLPTELRECFNSVVSQLCEAFGDCGIYPRRTT